MALDGCGHFCKYVVIIFNIIFALLGVAFLGLGLWLRFSPNTRGVFEVEELNSSAFVIAVTVLIVLGTVMLIVVSFGDYGACSENRCALQVFSALVAILAGAVVVIGVLAYANRDQVGLRFVEFYSSMYALYLNGGDPVIAATLTFLHNMLDCCGVTGIPLIELAKQTCPNRYFMSNCPGVIADVFDSKAPLVMGIFIGTGSLLVIALICSAILSKLLQQTTSSPQYIVMTQATPVSANHQLAQPGLVSTSYSYHYQDPVVFTPLTEANIPVTQADGAPDSC